MCRSKFFVYFLVCFYISFVHMWPYRRTSVVDCLSYNNSCVDICPEWMEPVYSDCNKTFWPSMRTCDYPEIQLVATLCGYARCDCPDQKAWDPETGYCYDPDNCPLQHND